MRVSLKSLGLDGNVKNSARGTAWHGKGSDAIWRQKGVCTGVQNNKRIDCERQANHSRPQM